MTRVVSAAVIIAVLVACLWWLPWWATVILTAIIAGAAAYELGLLARAVAGGPASAFIAVPAIAAAVGFVMSTQHGVPLGIDGLGVLLLAAAIVSGLVVLGSGPPGRDAFVRAAVFGMAPIYVGLPLGAAAAIHAAHGPAPLGWLVAVIAGSDSAQYYVGRSIGRRKLAPRVSPGKTIEGLAGGLVAAVIIGAALGPITIAGVSPVGTAVAALIIALVGVTGDLFESLLKRSAGVKDSSSLIPGHGGVLDRIDAYLFAIPAFYLYLRYFA